MRMWVNRRLGLRIVSLIAGVLIATSLLFLLILTPLYRYELLQERKAASIRLGAMLQIALENAMLKRDLPGLRQIVEDLGRMPSVGLAMIVEPKGEIRFSSHRDMIGQRRDPAALCAGCVGAAAGEGGDAAVAGFIKNERGADVLRSVRAVPNREPCGSCHGLPSQHPVNGYLVVDYAATDVTDRTWSTAALLGAAGLLVIVAALAAIWLALQRLIVRPLGEVADAIAQSTQSPSAPQAIAARPGETDEVERLVQGWNALVARLDATLQEIRAHEAFQQGLIDTIPDGVRVIAEDYSVVAANAAYCAQIGMSQSEVLAAPCYASSHGRAEPCVPTLVVCPLVEAGRHGAQVKCSHMHVDRSTGEGFAVEVAAAPLRSSLPNHTRLVVESIRNLSHQVQVSQEQRLSELGQLAAGVAHEIHNPLASVKLGLHAVDRALDERGMAGETREFMSAVNVEVERCLDVTGRLMRLSQLADERGGLVDFGQVARDAMTLLRYEAEARGIEMTAQTTGDARVIASDSDLGMVVINLMQNAIHAMPKGGCLTLHAALTSDKDVTLSVTDTGVGIDPSNLGKIFDPFWSLRADGTSGSGLGLAICKSLVAKWSGRISVRSEVNRGTTFEVALPHADKMLDAA